MRIDSKDIFQLSLNMRSRIFEQQVDIPRTIDIKVKTSRTRTKEKGDESR